MVRMVVTACLIMVMSVVLLFPVVEINQAQQGPHQRAGAAGTQTFADQVESDLAALETATSALTQAAVSSIRTLICLGETTVDVYRVLSGPAASGEKA